MKFQVNENDLNQPKELKGNGLDSGIEFSEINSDLNETIQVPNLPQLLVIVSWVKDNKTVGKYSINIKIHDNSI